MREAPLRGERQHGPQQGKIAARQRPKCPQFCFRPACLAGLQKGDGAPAAGCFQQRCHTFFPARFDMPGKAGRQAKGAARHQPVEGARFLGGLQQPGHMHPWMPGANGRSARPIGGGRAVGRRCAGGARGDLKIG